MQALLKAFWDIALWRRDPSHLPDSLTLVLVAATAYAAMSAVQSWMLYGADKLLARTAADLVLLVLLIWLVLAVTGRQHRLKQTLGAALGTGALLSPFVILLLAVRQPAGDHYGLALLVWGGSIAVILWYVFVLGHILRSALDTVLFTGVAIAVTYVVGSAAILTRLFPEGA
jgi:hypothetical protein